MPCLALFTEAVHRIPDSVYTPEQKAAWAPDPPQTERLGHLLESGYTRLAYRGAKLVGFGTLADADTIDLLYTHPEHQRTGVAGAIYALLEAKALRGNAPTLFTDASYAAKKFFLNRGFQQVREQAIPRGDVTLTNFRLRKVLA